MQPTLTALLIVSGIILINLSYYCFRQRDKSGAILFSVLLLAFAFHTIGYAFETISSTMNQILFWIKVEYIGIAFYPFLMMFFAREYTDERRFANNFILGLLLSVNVLTLILVFTDSYHHLFYLNTAIDDSLSLGFPALIITRGPWYYVHMVTLYTSIIYSMAVYGLNALQRDSKYGGKALIMFCGSAIPGLTSVAYYLGWTPAYLDVTPIGFFISAMFMVFGIVNHDILNLVPLTYKSVFDNIDEAVVTLDSEYGMLNFNQAARMTFKELSYYKRGQSIHAFANRLGIPLENSDSEDSPPLQVEYQGRYFEVKNKAVYNRKLLDVGRILVFRDVTIERRANERLEHLAITDGLTGLSNRRHFLELAEAANQLHQNGAFSIALLDIDHFKKVNDDYGHLVGDEVLIQLGALLKAYDNDNWISCRYGGEEFMIMAYDSDQQNIRARFEALHEAIRSAVFSSSDIPLTVSIGVTFRVGNESLNTLVGRADELLYFAKDSGRNRIAYEKRAHSH